MFSGRDSAADTTLEGGLLNLTARLASGFSISAQGAPSFRVKCIRALGSEVEPSRDTLLLPVRSHSRSACRPCIRLFCVVFGLYKRARPLLLWLHAGRSNNSCLRLIAQSVAGQARRHTTNDTGKGCARRVSESRSSRPAFEPQYLRLQAKLLDLRYWP